MCHFCLQILFLHCTECDKCIVPSMSYLIGYISWSVSDYFPLFFLSAYMHALYCCNACNCTSVQSSSVQCKSSRPRAATSRDQTFPHYFTVGLDLRGVTCVNKLRMHAAEERSRVAKTSFLPSAILEIWRN